MRFFLAAQLSTAMRSCGFLMSVLWLCFGMILPLKHNNKGPFVPVACELSGRPSARGPLHLAWGGWFCLVIGQRGALRTPYVAYGVGMVSWSSARTSLLVLRCRTDYLTGLRGLERTT